MNFDFFSLFFGILIAVSFVELVAWAVASNECDRMRKERENALLQLAAANQHIAHQHSVICAWRERAQELSDEINDVVPGDEWKLGDDAPEDNQRN